MYEYTEADDKWDNMEKRFRDEVGCEQIGCLELEPEYCICKKTKQEVEDPYCRPRWCPWYNRDLREFMDYEEEFGFKAEMEYLSESWRW